MPKTIYLDNIDSNFSGILYKINDYTVSLFIKGEQMKIINYDISLKGLIWKRRETKTLINAKISYAGWLNKNLILFMGEKKSYFVDIQLNKKNN